MRKFKVIRILAIFLCSSLLLVAVFYLGFVKGKIAQKQQSLEIDLAVAVMNYEHFKEKKFTKLRGNLITAVVGNLGVLEELKNDPFSPDLDTRLLKTYIPRAKEIMEEHKGEFIVVPSIKGD